MKLQMAHKFEEEVKIIANLIKLNCALSLYQSEYQSPSQKEGSTKKVEKLPVDIAEQKKFTQKYNAFEVNTVQTEVRNWRNG